MGKPPPLNKAQIEKAKKAEKEIKKESEAATSLVKAIFLILFVGIEVAFATVAIPVMYIADWPHALTIHLFFLLVFAITLAFGVVVWWMIIKWLKKYLAWRKVDEEEIASP